MPSHGSRRRTSRNRERADRLASHAALGAAAALAAQRHGVPIERVLAIPTPAETALLARAGRGRAGAKSAMAAKAATAARARHEAIYLAITVFDRTQKSIARALGASPKAIRRALHGIEDRREEQHYDRALEICEQQMMGAA